MTPDDDRFICQDFRPVVQTMWWEEFEKDIKDDGRQAELLMEIQQIRELLDKGQS